MLDNEELTGVFKAIVTDISCFKNTGKIKTRIAAFNGNSVPKNLLDNYDSDAFNALLNHDMLTDIMLPFGGGSNYGMFKLPQVNSVGLVTFINSNPNFPVWIGSTANSIISNNKVTDSDFPSDKIDNNKGIIYSENENHEPIQNYDDLNSFIIKTKTNTLEDFSNESTMDWTKNNVENAEILNKNKFEEYHVTKNGSKQVFSMHNAVDDNSKDEISTSMVISEDDEKRISIDEETILLENKKEKYLASISMNNDGAIFIQSNDSSANSNSGNVSAHIEIKPSHIYVVSGSSKIMLDTVNNNMTLSSNKVEIDAKEILLGNSGSGIVTTTNPGLNFKLADGSMLTSTKHIKV